MNLPKISLLRFIPSINVSANRMTMAVSFFFIAFCNFSFWKRFVEAAGGFSIGHLPLLCATFIILVSVFNAFLTLIAFRPLLKPVLIFVLLTASATVYFMQRYGVLIDAAMIQNVYETDIRESFELLSLRLVLVFLILGVLPSVIVWRAKLHVPPLKKDLWGKTKVIAISLVVAVVLLIVFFKSYASIIRENRDLRLLLTPTNYIQATSAYMKRKLSTPMKVAPLGTDAVKGGAWNAATRKTVTVIVVGETARAMNFSLNGYSRDTNPELSKQAGLINFSDVQSCGTATAVSVPCVFSALGRERYNEGTAKSQENLLDVLAHAGFNVVWIDNNSGCKGVCTRVQYEDMSKPVSGDPLCTSEECYDERMLQGLPELIRKSERDLVIVLHQKGSHGPAYSKRYPERFEHFKPVCSTSDLQECSTESIVNAYDNTILYTDHFLSRAIDLLKKSAANDGVDTALVYFSDHGESLGEKNLFLHGAPYFMSPIEQRHVPMMMWFSDGFLPRFQTDATCLVARSKQPYSHDNVFHSMLGMLHIQTQVYNPELDFFRTCSRGN